MAAKTMALLLAAVALSAAGQLLLKSGAARLAGLDHLEFLLAAPRNLHLVCGLGAWIASTLCWLYVLRVTPLSKAYALSSVTYVLVCVAGACVLGEPVRRLQVIGTALIIAGVACVLSGE
jgi:multidrug transporter EmrE-like cation transporter